MNKDQLLKQWEKDERAIFKGWDFSYIKGRYNEGRPDWNYKSIAKRLIKKSSSVLDVATGGGEAFSEILSVFKPKDVRAVEGYKPNVAHAKKNLKKYNAKVIYTNESKRLPYKREQFDLVLNRHGGLNVDEMARIIAHGGVFFTQQVDGRNLKDLMKLFGKSPLWESNTLSNLKRQFKNNGFKIISAKEWKGSMTFNDIGALIYFLKAVPWVVDDFSVNKYFKILDKLNTKIMKDGKIEFSARRFLILAEKQ